MAVWRSSNGIGLISKVTLSTYQAQLVLRWVIIHGYIASVCNQPLRPTQLPTLCRTRMSERGSGSDSCKGNPRSGVSLAIRHKLSLTVEALQGKMCQNSLPSGGGTSLIAKISGGSGPPVNILIRLERQLTALQLCC